MYRDFQSRNVMLKDGEPYFIDYQGGRKGPVYYDVASFLWQARAQYGPELKEELLQAYLESLREFRTVDETEFIHFLNEFVLFRLIQVLGAYGFRGYFEKKPHFLQSIPFALENLREILDSGDFDSAPYPYLLQVSEMTELKQFKEVIWISLCGNCLQLFIQKAFQMTIAVTAVMCLTVVRLTTRENMNVFRRLTDLTSWYVS